MKKAIVMTVLLAMMVSAVSFANGTGETTGQATTWGQGYGRYAAAGNSNFQRPFEQGDELTLTGTLKTTGDDRPVIVTGDGTYELMYPYIYSNNIELKDGQQITVKGYETPAYRWSEDGDEKHLMVTEADVDGKSYKLSSDDFGPKNGRGGAMRGSRTASAQYGRGAGNNSGRMGGRW